MSNSTEKVRACRKHRAAEGRLSPKARTLFNMLHRTNGGMVTVRLIELFICRNSLSTYIAEIRAAGWKVYACSLGQPGHGAIGYRLGVE